ncbi:MspA family porin [Nocardia miyunensis]|uniref:MspA family porin n=1 Tax=Nocardia miyunensis TaxID=282684 RepID=UPI002480546E|nr:MspA family porin [Nocardia miyunensis]
MWHRPSRPLCGPARSPVAPSIPKPLASAYGSTHLRELYVKTDGCGGYVSIRAFASVQVATPNANDSYSIFGDPTWL